jgi:hypothetical protein
MITEYFLCLTTHSKNITVCIEVECDTFEQYLRIPGSTKETFCVHLSNKKNCPIWTRNGGDIQIFVGYVTFELPGKKLIFFDKVNSNT